MSRITKLLLVSFFLISLALPITGSASAAKLTSTTPTPTQPNCILIKEAVAKGLVRLTLTGSGQLFFKSPVHYVIVNLTDKAIQICFPVGLILNPSDSGIQSMLLAKEVVLDLAPNQTLEGDLDAFCINEHKAAPTKDAEYQLGPMAKGNLLKLADAIQADSAQGRLGAQWAAWAITDQYSLNELTATPDPNQPSLTDSLRPLYCLTQDDVTLGQQLLQEANTGLSLYQGDNPLTAYCQSQGIPSIGQIGQRLKILGIEATIVVVVGALVCVGAIVGLILLIIRLTRKPK